MPKMVMFCGGASVGKTAVIRSLLPYLTQCGHLPCVCKVDCIQTQDAAVYQALGIPCVAGISGDICPDHFLVSNLPELWQWSKQVKSDVLLIETAGLCHRCSPATEKTLSVCVLDASANCHAPQKLGPMLTKADCVVLTKVDLISQAEREILMWHVSAINPGAAVFAVDGVAGYGAELLGRYICGAAEVESYENDLLRHDMPSGVCSYCIGEKRVGSAFQQGVVGKINFGEATG